MRTTARFFVASVIFYRRCDFSAPSRWIGCFHLDYPQRESAPGYHGHAHEPVAAALELTEARIWQTCRAAVGTPRLILVDNRRPPKPREQIVPVFRSRSSAGSRKKNAKRMAPHLAARRTNSIGMCWLNGGCAVPIIWSGRSKPPTHAPPKCGDQALSSMAWSNNFPPGRVWGTVEPAAN